MPASKSPGGSRREEAQTSSAGAAPPKNQSLDTSAATVAPPHPLAVKRTELVWEGKYDADGRRVAPVRVALPFQTVETVNESAADREALALFAGRITEKTPWRNRLIWGDKKYVLPSLLPEFAGKVNLIYIDPPFDTGADFSFTATVPGYEDEPGEEERGLQSASGDGSAAKRNKFRAPNAGEDDAFAFTKEPSIIEQKAYRDTWGRGLDSYLQWFYETAVLLHELLHENGSLYVHLDWHVVHYVKAVLDEVFSTENFRSEVIWTRTNAHNYKTKGFIRNHDTVLYYTKSDDFTYNQIYTEYSPEQLKRYRKDENGRLYTGQDLTFTGRNPERQFEWRGVRPPANRVWGAKREQLEAWWKEGRILKTQEGKPRLDGYKMFLDDAKGRPLVTCWNDLDRVGNTSGERLGYPTQKPEPLLDRILKASSNEGDLVLDCFCGSGTTAAVAEKLQRRWITCDLGRFAIHTARKRLLGLPGVRPFVVQNLGKYERQMWQAAQFNRSSGRESAHSSQADSESRLTSAATQEECAARQRAYVEFLLKLYNAKPVQGYQWLHGLRAGRMVHVGAVDGPVTTGDVAQIAAEFKKSIGQGADAPSRNGVDVLGWDFAFELNEVARQQAAAANIRMKFIRIPRDVMDQRAVESGDLHFFELGALSVEVKLAKREATLKLTEFVIPPDDVPEEARAAVKHWSQWVDYWAVDWDNQGDTFHNEWQAYRTRQAGTLALEAAHAYPEPGEYAVVLKVIDILGNDTTKTVKVRVK